MNKDIRLDTGYFDNRKIKRLELALGEHGVLCHLRLMAYTGRYCPDGILKDHDIQEIEAFAGWKGDPGGFVETISGARIRLLVLGDDGHYRLHDWEEHNRYAMNAETRKIRARIGAAAKYGNLEEVERLKSKLSGRRQRTPQRRHRTYERNDQRKQQHGAASRAVRQKSGINSNRQNSYALVPQRNQSHDAASTAPSPSLPFNLSTLSTREERPDAQPTRVGDDWVKCRDCDAIGPPQIVRCDDHGRCWLCQRRSHGR